MSDPGDPLPPRELYVTWSEETVNAVRRALRHREPLAIVQPEFLPTSESVVVRVSSVTRAWTMKELIELFVSDTEDGFVMQVEPGPYQDAWRERLGLPEAKS